MKRRTIIKGALGLAAGTIISPVPVGAVITPARNVVRLVGVGCVECRPDLYPAGFGDNRLPLGPNHYHFSWMRWNGVGAAPHTITLGGKPVKSVSEMMTGEDGWLIRNFDGPINPLYPSGNRAMLCECSMLNVKQELWRGPVEQVGIENLTVEEILAARAEEARRRTRFGQIEQFCEVHPEWADDVWLEQRDFPGRVPIMRRDAIYYENDWETGFKKHIPSLPYVRWIPMEAE